MKNKINRQLLPNIKFLDNEDRIFEYSGKETPLELALKSTKKSIFLVAEGGIGKSTTLRAFWLDFLRSKHKYACLYIDLRFLNVTHADNFDEKSTAISNYILDLMNCKGKDIKTVFEMYPILLLDGANELKQHFKTKQDNGICAFVSECNLLINMGFRLVISSRTSTVSESNLKDTANEFESDKMQYCKLCELTDKQVKIGIENDEVFDTELLKLLHNNMMLSMYKELAPADKKELLKTRLTAGELLNKYFEKCIKNRFIAISCELSEYYDKFPKSEFQEYYVEPNYEKVFNFLVENADADCFWLVDNQYWDRWEKILELYDKLGNNSSEVKQALEEFNDLYGAPTSFTGKESTHFRYGIIENRGSISVETLEKIAIICTDTSDKSGRTFVWANEIYQEYFKARKYYDIFNEIEKIGFSEELEAFEISLKDMLKHEKSAQYFNIIKLVGELLDITDVRMSKLISLLDNNYVFRKCLISMSVLCGLDLPKEIKHIEDSTFSKCHDLRKIDLTKVIAIGDKAFANCNLLEEVIFQDDKDQIGTLENKKFLESIVPMRVGRIGERAFCNCKKLKSITIPETYRIIDEAAFAYCDSLETVKLPQTVWIDGAAFRGCKKLKEINIIGVDLDVNLGEDVFSGCESLVCVNLPYGVRDIGEYAFSECKALNEITLPLSIHEIKKCTFQFCKSLEAINLPEQLEEIGEGAFWGCESLKKIVLPESLIKIGKIAFEYCIALQEITLPENLQEIDMSAFMYCRELKKIYISVKTNIVSYNKIVEGFYACNAKIIRY